MGIQLDFNSKTDKEKLRDAFFVKLEMLSVTLYKIASKQEIEAVLTVDERYNVQRITELLDMLSLHKSPNTDALKKFGKL